MVGGFRTSCISTAVFLDRSRSRPSIEAELTQDKVPMQVVGQGCYKEKGFHRYGTGLESNMRLQSILKLANHRRRSKMVLELKKKAKACLISRFGYSTSRRATSSFLVLK